jgi:hypothetical protein
MDPPIDQAAVITTYKEHVQMALNQHSKAARAIIADHLRHQTHKDARKIQRNWWHSPKKVNKRIFGVNNNSGSANKTIDHVQHPLTKTVVTDPEEMKEAIRLHHMILQSPKVPAHTARAFPWCTNEAINVLDGFHLERRGTPDQPLYQHPTSQASSPCSN